MPQSIWNISQPGVGVTEFRTTGHLVLKRKTLTRATPRQVDILCWFPTLGGSILCRSRPLWVCSSLPLGHSAIGSRSRGQTGIIWTHSPLDIWGTPSLWCIHTNNRGSDRACAPCTTVQDSPQRHRQPSDPFKPCEGNSLAYALCPALQTHPAEFTTGQLWDRPHWPWQDFLMK